MARRKPQFMDDGSDSDSDEHSGDDLADSHPDDNDDHDAGEPHFPRHGRNSRGQKRTREQRQDDATYGVFAPDAPETTSSSSRAPRQNAKGKRTDYLAGQSFVAAGSSSSSASAPSQDPRTVQLDNLSTALSIEPAREDEEDVAMDLDSASDADSHSDEGPGDDNDQDREGHGNDDDDDEELAPVPGLDPVTTAANDDAETTNSLGFAPRGLGAGRASRGRGARGGLGSNTMGRARIGSMSMFAAATSASTTTDSARPLQPTDADRNGAAKDHVPVDETSRATTPRAGLGSRGGIGSKPPPSLIDSLRAELNGNPPSAASTTTPAPSTDDYPATTSAPRRQPPAAVPHEPTVTLHSNSGSGPNAAAPARRSFLPSAPPTPSSSSSSLKRPTPLSRSESLHFSQLRSTNSVGLKLLEKMGWSASSGAGLGKDGTGIVVPLGEGQKLRKKGAGIQQGERSRASWEEEARRKGVSVDELMGREKKDDSEREGRDDGARTRGRDRRHREAWAGPTAGGAGSESANKGSTTKSKRERKVRTEFKTYEEILAENGGDAQGASAEPRELLVDLSGNALPDQSIAASLPSLAFGAGSADPTRLPELRHNLVLLTSTLSSHLRALAKEGSGVISRRQYLAAEETRVRTAVEKQSAKMHRLESILAVVGRVKDKEVEVRELVSMLPEGGDEMSESLDKFRDEFDDLLGLYGTEYEELGLDHVVVGAIAPICRRIFQTWDPLSNPSLCVAQFKRYRKHFLIDKHLVANSTLAASAVDIYGSELGDADAAISERRRLKLEAERTMTAYESFMWTVWLPKIRSAINNDWSPSDPARAVTLFTTWAPLLPAFLHANILDQLVLPKLSTAVQNWSASAYKRGQAPGLHTIVFPWLDVAGEDRLAPVLDETKRRVRTWIKSGWKPREGVPAGFSVWRDAFSKSDWDSVVLHHVLPQLGQHLRDEFVVNPRQQDVGPVDRALAWRTLVATQMLSQLLENEFFPKWGDALWTWLTSDGVNLEQVAEWYSWWKSYFPEDVVALKGVQRGFRKGLDLMNQAMALGEDVKYRLKKPDFRPKQSSSSSSSRKSASASKSTSSAPHSTSAPTTTDVSFRSIVEDLCTAANLLFLSTGRTTSRGRTLYRVAENVDGRGGVVCYLEDDVVWVVGKAGEGDAEPVGIEELISRAKGSK